MRKIQKVNAKIERIQHDLAYSRGLTEDEITVAIRTDLIDPEQAWCGGPRNGSKVKGRQRKR